jgi:chromosome condensin MukBEF ATPase and DNA-binding subunit MukB
LQCNRFYLRLASLRTKETRLAELSLELLRTMVQRVLEGQLRAETKLDRIVDDLSDLRLRTTNTEEALAGVNRRLDRLDVRVERIERRLDLSEAHT